MNTALRATRTVLRLSLIAIGIAIAIGLFPQPSAAHATVYDYFGKRYILSSSCSCTLEGNRVSALTGANSNAKAPAHDAIVESLIANDDVVPTFQVQVGYGKSGASFDLDGSCGSATSLTDFYEVLYPDGSHDCDWLGTVNDSTIDYSLQLRPTGCCGGVTNVWGMWINGIFKWDSCCGSGGMTGATLISVGGEGVGSDPLTSSNTYIHASYHPSGSDWEWQHTPDRCCGTGWVNQTTGDPDNPDGVFFNGIGSTFTNYWTG